MGDTIIGGVGVKDSTGEELEAGGSTVEELGETDCSVGMLDKLRVVISSSRSLVSSSSRSCKRRLLLKFAMRSYGKGGSKRRSHGVSTGHQMQSMHDKQE